MTDTKQDIQTFLARYGVRDANEGRDLWAKLRDFYERTLTERQGAYLNLEDGRLVRKTQPLALIYRIGTAILKLWPATGAGQVVVARK